MTSADSQKGAAPSPVKLSVAVLTYNHARYLKQALDSVMMQQTSFPFRIVVLDDCSTDGTTDLLAAYQRRYPERITSIVHQENAGALASSMELLNSADGEYVAMLEGDDFWLDPHKLQTQVDFLEGHPEFVLCGHDCVILNEWTGTEVIHGHGVADFTLSLENLIDFHLPTASMVFRNGLVREWPEPLVRGGFGDRPLAIMLAQVGKVRHLARPMSVYRVHSAGIWCGRYILDPYANQLETTAEGWQLMIGFWEALAIYLDHQHDDRIGQLVRHARWEIVRADVASKEPSSRNPVMDSGGVVSVLRPTLPTAEKLLPYLRRIDRSRVYTNFGPLNAEFEDRLTHLICESGAEVVTANSGTAALAGAILAVAGRAQRDRPLALLPSFTFVATATAVEMCGYAPHLADIGAESWMMDPAIALASPALSAVGVVVPVAPFGRLVPQAQWLDFQTKTGIPVVIDGAASFDSLFGSTKASPGDVPVALSFHATKSFGVGEGGCVVLGDAALARRVRQVLNFGFYGSREARTPHLNGKFSEYQAAVGLAELDEWPQKHARLAAVANEYRRCLAGTSLATSLIATPDISSSYILLCCDGAVQAERIQQALTEQRIDTRRWYGYGLHRHHYYAGITRDDLSVTARLAPTLIGLPLATDLSGEVIRRIADTLLRAVSE